MINKTLSNGVNHKLWGDEIDSITKNRIVGNKGESKNPTGVVKSLVPTMTSAISGSGYVYASSSINENKYAPFMAFNGVKCSSDCSNGWLASESDNTPFIEFIFNKTKYIENIVLESYNNSTDITVACNVELSDNGNDWVSAQMDITFAQNTYGEYTFELNTPVFARFVKLQFSDKLYYGVNLSAGCVSRITINGRDVE